MVNETEHSLTDLGISGRRILITGAAQGIGRATAIWLSNLGARPVLADIQDCASTRDACCAGTETFELDLAKPKSIAALVANLRNGDAPLFGMVNCAGLLLRRQLEV